MKGLESVKAFLCSKNEDTLSSAKDSLPSSEVDRDALIQALLEVRVELATLRASDQTSASTSVVTERSKPRALTSTAAQSELKATAAEFVQAAQNVASSEKSEQEKMCKSMWGKTTCPGLVPGASCERVHIRWCSKPTCFLKDSPEEMSKECNLWHGHMRVALQKERARKKKETELKQFKTWKKQQDQGNSTAKGSRGKPQRGQQKPQTHGQKQGHGNQGKHKQVHVRQQKGWGTPQRPGPLNLGDFFPPLPPPTRKSAWATPVTTPTQPAVAPLALGSEAARIQVQQLLQGLGMLLSSGAI